MHYSTLTFIKITKKLWNINIILKKNILVYVSKLRSVTIFFKVITCLWVWFVLEKIHLQKKRKKKLKNVPTDFITYSTEIKI